MNFNITRQLSALVLIIVSCQVWGAPFPYVINFRITYCDPIVSSWCTVPYYASDGTEFIDLGSTIRPDPSQSLKVVPAGIYCKYGSSRKGWPFEQCRWDQSNPTLGGAIAPLLTGKCELKSYESWELTADSTCATRSGNYSGGHASGAEPGGACVMFTQYIPNTVMRNTITTPIGVLDATTVANSGNTFCPKALPPDVTCNLNLPSQIDHGIVTPSATSTVSITGTVDCGDKPKVEFVGGSSVTLGDGVTTQLSYQMSGSQSVRVISNMTTSNSLPGVYSASVIVVVSPL